MLMCLCVQVFPRSLLAAEGQVFSPLATQPPPKKKPKNQKQNRILQRSLALLLPSAKTSRDDGWLHGKVVRLSLTFPLNLR